MDQSKQEADKLMEEQRLGGPQPSDVDDDFEDEEEFCYYCGEPLEDGMCSAECVESADDEDRRPEDIIREEF